MIYKIKANGDFRRLYSKGKSLVDKAVVMYCMPTKRKKIRIGVACGKKVGNAVKRNRAKRVMREAVRSLMPQLSGSYDIILVGRSLTPKLKSTQVAAVLKKMFISVGVIDSRSENPL